MANWTVISDTALGPDAPLTSELAYAWRDNAIAITEGAAGAPRIVAGAMSIATNSVSGTLGSGARVRINLNLKSFFPDIRGIAMNFDLNAVGTASPTTPGFELYNTDAAASQPYSVAWEYIAT